MKLEIPKGMKDYGPEEKIVRDNVLTKLKTIFERYGFNPLETPMMEKFDVLSSKYTGGSEILKETYKLKDQGKRDLGLRYDLTVPFARYIGMNPFIKMPFKRYQIGPVFRDGPIKKGRLRQFYQCDVDVVGSNSMLADAECIKVALDVFTELNLKVKVKVNNRKILNALVKEAGIKKIEESIIILDKLEKFGKKEVLKEMKAKGIDGEKLLKLAEKLTLKDNYEGISEVKEVLSYIDDRRVEFSPTLARGLSYYTGTIFEVFSEGLDSSLAAGGRYDNMIGAMIGKGDFSAVGISFGIEPICTILKDEKTKSVTKVLVVPIGDRKPADKITSELRKEGINTDTDLIGRGLTKNLNYANSYNIPYVLIVGEKEAKAKKYNLKDMASGKEFELSLKDLIKKLML